MDDPGPSGLIFKFVLLFVLILINAFFAMCEIAVISLNDNKLRRLAEDGHKGAKKILMLTKDSARFLSTIQVGITITGFLTSASAAENFAGPVRDAFVKWFNITSPTTMNVMHGFALVIVTLIISMFSLILGELVPKRIAMQKPEAISFKVVGFLTFISRALKPIVWFLSTSTNLIVRMFGFDPYKNEETVTEEEILFMVDVGEEKGVIEESQKEMINNVLEFDDINAADVMTHRTDIEAVSLEDSINDVLEISIEKGFTRIPVFEDDLDDIVGIINVKDLLPYIGKPMPEKGLKDLMRPVFFVPESKRCKDLFKEMTEKKIQAVIVSDEYGGTAGLVSVEDLIESIVGDIQDEYDDETEEMTQVNETDFTVDGTMNIDELDDELEIELPKGDYDTIGGLIMSEIGHIPAEDEHPEVKFCGYKFTVQKTDERRIEEILVEKIPEDASLSGENDKKDK